MVSLTYLPQDVGGFLHRCFLLRGACSYYRSSILERTSSILTRKYCLAILDLYAASRDAIIVEYPVGEEKVRMKKGFLSTYDDTL